VKTVSTELTMITNGSNRIMESVKRMTFLSDEDLKDQKLMAFLEDKKAVRQFLQCHLKNYRNTCLL
jgi:hypothetical protein